MHKGIIDFFEKHVEDDFAGIRMRCHVTDEKGHGREEARYYMICPVPEDSPDRSRWIGLKAIGVAINETQRDGKKVGENRKRRKIAGHSAAGGAYVAENAIRSGLARQNQRCRRPRSEKARFVNAQVNLGLEQESALAVKARDHLPPDRSIPYDQSEALAISPVCVLDREIAGVICVVVHGVSETVLSFAS